MKLPCEECTKTNNHCCKADIPYEVPIALSIIARAKERGYTNLHLASSNKFPQRVYILDPDMELIDNSLEKTNCVFFKKGKCDIYDIRPDICRWYGTKEMRCRFEVSACNTKEEIEELDHNDLLRYDQQAIEFSTISDLKINFINLKYETKE